MSEKSREKRHTPFQPRQTREGGQTKAGRNQNPKPYWPTGLLLALPLTASFRAFVSNGRG